MWDWVACLFVVLSLGRGAGGGRSPVHARMLIRGAWRVYATRHFVPFFFMWLDMVCVCALNFALTLRLRVAVCYRRRSRRTLDVHVSLTVSTGDSSLPRPSSFPLFSQFPLSLLHCR